MSETARKHRLWPAAIGFAALFIVALFADRPVAVWVRDSGLGATVKATWWAEVVKEPGEFRLACAVAVSLVVLRVLDWRQGVFIGLAGVMGIINDLLKWIVGRHRPFTFRLEHIDEAIPWNVIPFRTGVPLGKLTSNLSFASGHATASFATATALAILLPRWRWLFYGLAMLTALERVAENAHWASDVVAGAALSWFGVHGLWWLAQRSALGPVGSGERGETA
ncbi:MAG: phosphatase PAP2 family protein [Tepidisphaerales bacterium]